MKKADLKKQARRVVSRMPPRLREPLLSARAKRRFADDLARIAAVDAFDLEWYEAQTGTTFESAEAACLDYLRTGRRAGRSPHPVFEPRIAQPKTWNRVGVDPLVDSLRGNRAKDSVGVHLTLPRNWAEPVSAGMPRWLDWVQNADESTPMPTVHDESAQASTTWGEFRRRALEVAVSQRHTRSLATAPRISRTPPPPATGPDGAPVPSSTDGTPLVSVVLPTWNRASMLRRAVESVQAQTLQDWELVVVDDGSDDDTMLVLEGITRFDSRVVVIEAAHGGVSRARNTAIAAARGRYIAFLDSDNAWNADFLERAVAFLAVEKAPWGHAILQLERDNGTFYRSLEGDREHLLTGNYIDLNTLIVERLALEKVGGFDETLRRAVDYDLILRLSALWPPRLIPTIGAVYSDRNDDLTRISNSEPMAWNQVVLVKHLVDVEEVSKRPTVAGRVSVVMPVRSVLMDLVVLVDRLLAEPGDVEVVVVTAASEPAFVRMAELAALSRPGMKVVSMATPALEFGGLVDLGAGASTGEYLVPWSPNNVGRPGWAAALVSALDEPGVAMAQPLVLDQNGTVSSAGAVFVGNDPNPWPLLGGFPIEDSSPLGTSVVPAALSGVIMIRAADFWRLGGLDAIYGNDHGEVDLSLRAQRDGVGSTVVAASAQIVTSNPKRFGFPHDIAASATILRERHIAPRGSSAVWNKLSFEQTGRRAFPLAGPNDVPSDVIGVMPVVRPILERVTEGAPQLRWAIDTAAPSGDIGLQWGDTHFAGSLAGSLRALGQVVHVDRRTAREGAHRDFDDVTLVLRGLDLVAPRPGAISIMWVISHPDLVSAKECAAYDHVFAASTLWAGRMSERWGMRVDPLLQCTDARLFRPDAAEPDTADALVFVGNSRGVYRPSVKQTIEVGLSPSVYGNGWTGLIPDELIRGTYVPNEKLAALYASSGAVLNDHWEDMRLDGFISNRVFDVLATGGRLISDDVAGLDELVGSAVRIVRSNADVAGLLAGDWRRQFPGREARLMTAEHVRAEHTFDVRARALLDAALRVRADRPDAA
ncbi:MAG: glycosyltransferase [Jatrophihabitantaceae bacterium]